VPVALTFPLVTVGGPSRSRGLATREFTITTILLVDDEPDLLEVSRRALERHGYRVLEAQTSRAALAIAESHLSEIGLLVTDIVIPEMSGPALARRLVGIIPGLRVIYMSGKTEDTMIDEGVVPGASYLQKPYSPDQLVQAVRQRLEHSGE
jgi:two-component system, cell cycle sensor histidine kinase and response regulator CckA